ncbi:MAG: FkbM family methyltransferase [Chthoniobacter sp.]|nr:FkbM family methyltransferase [Chthoniobacter sp.]
MKRTLHYLLSRQPFLYRLALGAIQSPNREKRTFLRLVRDGDVVFDIGANRGDFTVLFSHMVGCHGRAHAFEPVPPTFQELSERIRNECRFPNVSLNPCALGDTEGQFQIQVPAGDFGQASLRNHAIASWSRPERESFDCQVRTLDAYVTEKAIDRLDFVKIDIEGAELPALRGGQQTLDRFHPTIHCEYFAPWTEAFGYGAADLISFLQTHGYTHFYSGDLVPLSSPVQELEKMTESQNLVCATKPLVSTNT